MKLIFVDESWEDYLYWQQTDKKILARINKLIEDIIGRDESQMNIGLFMLCIPKKFGL